MASGQEADSQDDPQVEPPSYEPPDPDRPGSASPTEAILEYEAQQRHDPYAAFRIPQFRWYMGGWLVQMIGHQMLATAVAWEVFDRTNSKLALGLIAGVQVVPLFVLGLPAGQLADRYDRRRIIQISAVGAGICSFALAALSYRPGTVPWMFAVVALSSAFLVCGRPARQALLPLVVPRDTFTNAMTWNSSLFQIATMLGPALAGLLLSHGVWMNYAIDGVCTLVYIVSLFFVRFTPQDRAGSHPHDRGIQGLLAGLHFVRRTPLMAASMVLDLVAVLLGGATYLLPVFARDVLETGGAGFGGLRAAEAIGAFTMAILVAHTPPFRRAGRAMLLAVAGFGVCTIVFGLSRSYWLSFAMLVGIGAFDMISVVIRHTVVQVLTPDSMRGRVSAVNNMSIGASNELGGLESGVAAAFLGPVVAVVGGGVGTLMAVAGAWVVSPALRTLGRLNDLRPVALSGPPTSGHRAPITAATQ